MVSLGPVILSDELILTGLESSVPVIVSSRRTITGRHIVRTDPAPGGRKLSLDGTHHFTYAQRDAVVALAALGQPVTLVHHRGTFVVRIIGLQLEPSIKYRDPIGTDWLSGSILLLEE